jgi:hypothetical protein
MPKEKGKNITLSTKETRDKRKMTHNLPFILRNAVIYKISGTKIRTGGHIVLSF